MSRPFAVFDIDGTVIRWQLYHAVTDQLVKDGLIDAAAFEHVRHTRMNWKKRTGTDSFREYERELVKVFTRAVRGMDVADFVASSDKVFDEYKDQVYTYTRDLIRRLQAENYLLFAISGSHGIIIKKLAGYYGFDDFAATEYPAINGRFTGEEKGSIGKKPQLLKELMERHGASTEGSIGVGDSEGDIGMLQMVERPIAFNPNRQLFEHAQREKWEIIVERKNVVYKLEPGQNTYRLAE